MEKQEPTMDKNTVQNIIVATVHLLGIALLFAFFTI